MRIFGKKAQLPMEELVKWIIILIGLALIVFGIYLLRDKLGSIFDSLRQSLRFGK